MESAKDDLADLSSMWADGPPPESETYRCKAACAEAKGKAMASRRRADFAHEGYLFLSDTELGDHEFMGQNESLIGEAYSRKRVRHGQPIDPGDSVT